MVSAIEKRLQALERQIIARAPVLVFAWTPSLARRIEAVRPAGSNLRCVCLSFASDETAAEFEADLRKSNPNEGERLDALLRGEIPAECYPAITPGNPASA
jgi:hypothetical protein